jgi:hypothetical protein
MIFQKMLRKSHQQSSNPYHGIPQTPADQGRIIYRRRKLEAVIRIVHVQSLELIELLELACSACDATLEASCEFRIIVVLSSGNELVMLWDPDQTRSFHSLLHRSDKPPCIRLRHKSLIGPPLSSLFITHLCSDSRADRLQHVEKDPRTTYYGMHRPLLRRSEMGTAAEDQLRRSDRK